MRCSRNGVINWNLLGFVPREIEFGCDIKYIFIRYESYQKNFHISIRFYLFIYGWRRSRPGPNHFSTAVGRQKPFRRKAPHLNLTRPASYYWCSFSRPSCSACLVESRRPADVAELGRILGRSEGTNPHRNYADDFSSVKDRAGQAEKSDNRSDLSQDLEQRQVNAVSKDVTQQEKEWKSHLARTLPS
jgi:hypothetical protein